MSRKSRWFMVLSLVFLLAGCAPRADLPPLKTGIPKAALVLPEDLGSHAWAKHEWWYYTGHLAARDGRRFGFEITFFRFRVDDNPSAKYLMVGITHTGYMAHMAVVDETTGRHKPVFMIAPQGKNILASPGKYDLRFRSWYAKGDLERQEAHAESKDMALTLEFTALKPPVLHGDQGVVRKGEDLGNYYLSITRLSAKGTLELGGERIPVEGTAWFDHEFGHMGDIKSRGWDWYSIRNDDHTEFMIYMIRDQSGKIEEASRACRIDEKGREDCVPYSEIEVEVMGRWLSPKTRAAYPSGWRIKMPKWKADLTIMPVAAAQEFPFGPVPYWEGSCTVMGSHPGRAFIELVGYLPR